MAQWGERDTCRSCGSEHVTHIVLGRPRPGEAESAPSWISFAGCVVTSYDDRTCDVCGHRWLSRAGLAELVGERVRLP